MISSINGDIEQFLEEMVETGNFLLHGSRHHFDTFREGMVFATDSPKIAMLKALVSNEGVNLRYPIGYFHTEPFTTRIEDFRPEVIEDKGIIYFVRKEGFIQPNKKRREFISYSGARITTKVPITIEQYPYPIYDGLGNRVH